MTAALRLCMLALAPAGGGAGAGGLRELLYFSTFKLYICGVKRKLPRASQ